MADAIQVEGLDALIRAFAQLPEEAIDYLQPAIVKDTQIILNRARIELEPHNKTGALSRSLKINKPKRAKKYKYQIFASVYFAQSGRHGVPLELGHKFSGFLKDKVGRVPEKPFLRPAADKSKADVIRDISDAMNKALDQWGRN
jgi:hypothetical protein